VALRYCTNCGTELREEDRFCRGCGRPVDATAVVAIPESDVPVPPPPPQEASSEQAPSATGGLGGVHEPMSRRNAYIALGVTILIFALVIAVAAKSVGWTFILVIALAVVFYRFFYLGDDRGVSDKDDAGRLVLRAGHTEPISEAERSRELDEEIQEYVRQGFFVRHRTATTAQLVRPKRFSFVWALLWFLMFGIGILVYLIYYAAKQDEGRYAEVDEYGEVKATRQIRHVL
jgi:Ca2+/Na+ antiporter